MANITPQQGVLKRLNIDYFEGINNLVGDNLSKKSEFIHAENARSQTIGYVEKRGGYKRLGDTLSSPTNYGMYYFESTNASSSHFWTVASVAATTRVYYLNTSATWTTLADADSTGLTATNHFFTIANKNLYIVNGTDANRYVGSDGATVTTSATATGNLYNCPIAKKIAFYKEKLYVGDYKIGSLTLPTHIMFSSKLLGIVSLVDGDHASGVTTVNVTDTKYIHPTDSLDVYRGATKIATLTISAKTESTITVTATGVALLSADELWVADTYSTNARVFRWADNPSSGTDAKQYDTFQLAGAGDYNMTILDTINDYLIISNKKNIGVFNGSSLKMFDMGFGCVSERGYVKYGGVMFFASYNGIYATSGYEMPKLISSKIQKTWDGASKSGKEAAAMGVKGTSIFCSIGDVTLYKQDGSVDKTLSDVVIEYDTRQQNWFQHIGVPVKEFRTYIGSVDPDRLEYSASTASAGHIYEMFYGTVDDDGTDNEIPFIATIGSITLSSSFENICHIKEIILEVKQGSGIKCFLSLDDGPFYSLEGEARKGANKFKVTPKSTNESEARCRTLSLSFREMSGRAVKISRAAIVYFETSESETYHK